MRMTTALAAIAAAIAGSTGALAQGSEGFFAGVEVKFVQPSNVGMPYVFAGEFDSLLPVGEYRSVDFSEQPSYEIWFGRSRGKSGWAFSYWTFDEQSEDRVNRPDGGVLRDILAHPFLASEPFGAEVLSASASVGVDAQSLDLLYWNNAVGSDRIRLTWYAGLRYASLDTEIVVDYAEQDSFGPFEVFADSFSETEGFGFTGGIRGSVLIADKLYLYGGFGYGLIRADVISVTEQGFDRSLFPDVEVLIDDERGLSMIEADVGIEWQVTGSVHLTIGYDMSHWGDAVNYVKFNPDQFQLSSPEVTTLDATFDGISAGVGLVF